MPTSSRAHPIVLGVCGGIAAYKAALVLRLLTEAGHDVQVIPTVDALRMVGAPTWEALSRHPVATGIFDQAVSVDHIRIAKTAKLIVIAPATAQTIAKIAAGMADNLLTAVVLATTAPVVVVPAMHTEMWLNPATQANVATLRERGIVIMEPAQGRLTGSDSGLGRLPDPAAIAALALSALSATKVPVVSDFSGQRVLITAGGTQEPIDPVRFIANRSSGRQGIELALEAAARGAQVTLLAANITHPLISALPSNVTVVPIITAAELHREVLTQLPAHNVLIMAAAVADYRPETPKSHKLKKSADASVTLRLVQNPDILRAAVANRSAGQIIIGFAAETGDETNTALTLGRQKARRKGADLLAINEVGATTGFGDVPNYLTVVTSDGTTVTAGGGTKREAAAVVLDAVRARWATGGKIGTSGAVD